ncbi:MAG: hypothetical protein GY880_12930 [Planctomycetaceae bacterium]|nr:hypothetical protein [Planctomycetaceae bacterium]
MTHYESFIATYPNVPAHWIEVTERTTQFRRAIEQPIDFFGIEPNEDEVVSAVAHVNLHL